MLTSGKRKIRGWLIIRVSNAAGAFIHGETLNQGSYYIIMCRYISLYLFQINCYYKYIL